MRARGHAGMRAGGPWTTATTTRHTLDAMLIAFDTTGLPVRHRLADRAGASRIGMDNLPGAGGGTWCWIPGGGERWVPATGEGTKPLAPPGNPAVPPRDPASPPPDTGQPQPQPPAGQTTPESPEAPASRWLSVNQIRMQQRCRRAVVIAAMDSGQLPYEQRGRIRYARVCDVLAWEQSRLIKPRPTEPRQVHPSLEEFL